MITRTQPHDGWKKHVHRLADSQQRQHRAFNALHDRLQACEHVSDEMYEAAHDGCLLEPDALRGGHVRITAGPTL
jgi:hypothetical protein